MTKPSEVSIEGHASDVSVLRAEIALTSKMASRLLAFMSLEGRGCPVGGLLRVLHVGLEAIEDARLPEGPSQEEIK